MPNPVAQSAERTRSAACSAASSCSATRSRPRSQKAGIGEVDADDPTELLGRAGASAGEHLEVVGDDLLAALDVEPVNGERQQLAVRVRVDVARRADEVGDVGPPGPVAVGDLDRVAEHLGLGLGPELAEAVDRELTLLPARRVDEVLEAVHRDLTEHRRDLPLDRLGQQVEAGARIGCVGEQSPEDELLGEHRGGLGDRQRSALVEDALLAGEVLMDAVAELMRQRGHVAAPVGPVEHHIGMDRGDRRGAEGAAALARPRRDVDPAIEEPPGDLAHPRGDGIERLEHDLAALAPADLLLVGADDGHPVVVGEPLDPEQLRLRPVPAARQLAPRPHGFDQRLDRFVGCLVREVAGREPVRVIAQPVHRRLLLKQRVEGVGAGAQAGFERGRDRLGNLAPPLPLGVEEPGEGDVERHRVVVARELDPDRRGELVEEPAPGAAAGQRELRGDSLLGRAQQVGAVAPLHPQVMAAEVHAVGGEQLIGAGVVDRDPLEVEEDESRLDRGGALRSVLEQRADRRVLGVGGEAQVRVVECSPDDLGEPTKALHRVAQARAVELADPALELGGDLDRDPVGLVEQRVDRRPVVGAAVTLDAGGLEVDQVAQVPGVGDGHRRKLTGRPPRPGGAGAN